MRIELILRMKVVTGARISPLSNPWHFAGHTFISDRGTEFFKNNLREIKPSQRYHVPTAPSKGNIYYSSSVIYVFQCKLKITSIAARDKKYTNVHSIRFHAR